jgi:hypothetical protein
MDSGNRRLSELERILQDVRARGVLQARLAAMRARMVIPRVFSVFDDDTDADDAPDAFVTSRLRPRTPLRGSAIAVPEPDEDVAVVALGQRR